MSRAPRRSGHRGRRHRSRWIGILGGGVLWAFTGPGHAYAFNEQFAIGGLLASTLQCQVLSEKAQSANRCRGALPVQAEVSFRPTVRDEFFSKFGFAAENALNDATPFVGGLWAADLEDDVKDINGRGRNYLLTVWYKQAFELGGAYPLEVTLGIIDSTDYLDTNAYAHDEYTQFMNPLLVTARSGFYPSYDYGAAVTLKKDWLDLRGLIMNVGKNEEGNGYNFLGLHLGYEVTNRLGNGDYRLVLSTTSRGYRDPRDGSAARQEGLMLSLDQQVGDVWGGFLRLGWTNGDTSFPFRSIYSAGIDLCGKPWKRPQDNVGIGYAYLLGANQGVGREHIVEIYYRFVMVDNLAFTADLQYLDEVRKNGESPRGWVFGLRAVAEF